MTTKNYNSSTGHFFIENNKTSNFFVISSFALTKGSFFYEIELIYGSKIQVGWITRLAKFNYNNGIENESSTVVFDTSLSFSGEVFGCFVNIEQKTITFYRNGKIIDMKIKKEIFNFLPIFAVATVKHKHIIYVNFGQANFKHPPWEHYETFFKPTIENNNFFQLKIKKNFKWFCIKRKTNDEIEYRVYEYHQNNLNIYKIPIFFCDLKQKYYDETVVKIEEMLNNSVNYENINTELLRLFDSNRDENLILRLFQSIIEVTGYKIAKNKIEMLNYYIIFFGKLINQLENSFAECVNHAFFAYYFSYFNLKLNPIRKSKIIIIKIRYFILLIFILCKSFYFKNKNYLCCNYLNVKCKNFLIDIINYLPDYWSKLYSIILLTNNNFNEMMNYSLNFFELWEDLIDNENILINSIKNNENNCPQLQLYIFANYYVCNSQKNNVVCFNKHEYEKNFQLNPNDKTENILLSPSNLMARNINCFEYFTNKQNFGTIRSIFSFNPGSFYFEVTILTVGEMRIGLAAKQMNIDNLVGDDSISIGIDGYNRCVWMHKKKYLFKNKLTCWNSGDVIGIYFDFNKNTILFGINEKIIYLVGNPFQEEFIFSVLPCHVAVSLAPQQQCFFNFEIKNIPLVFKEKLKNVDNNVQLFRSSVLVSNGSANLKSIEINGNFVQNVMSNNANEESKEIWTQTTKQISFAFSKYLSGNLKNDSSITINLCENWRDNMETIFNDLNNDSYNLFEKYMKKVGIIYEELKKLQFQKDQNTNEFCIYPLLKLLQIENASDQLNIKYATWLINLQLILCSEGVAEAIESPKDENDEMNLIAKGRILLNVPSKLKISLKKLNVAFYMMEVLQEKYNKFLQKSQTKIVNINPLP